MNRFVYMTKGTYDGYYPIFYVIETELTYDQVLNFIDSEAQRHIDRTYTQRNKNIDDEYNENFRVKINNREYTFCLGDHNGKISYEVLFKYDDFMGNHKMKINLEDVVWTRSIWICSNYFSSVLFERV